MCTVCGCGNNPLLNYPSPRKTQLDQSHFTAIPSLAQQATSSPQQDPPEKENTLHYGLNTSQTSVVGLSESRVIKIEADVLAANQVYANQNRQWFTDQAILTLNLLSSPGSGKTTLLCETILRLNNRLSLAVIEGDQQTSLDAQRIRATGVSAIQINTGKGCHLDARMISEACAQLSTSTVELLLVENVGNLVCPALWDLGEAAKVVILSVTEGADKPLKYPDMFAAAKLLLINKIDLLPYVQFDVAQAITYARQINPSIDVIEVSATQGQGMDHWLNWITNQRRHITSPQHFESVNQERSQLQEKIAKLEAELTALRDANTRLTT